MVCKTSFYLVSMGESALKSRTAGDKHKKLLGRRVYKLRTTGDRFSQNQKSISVTSDTNQVESELDLKPIICSTN